MNTESSWPEWVRILARILCPIILAGTFTCMEIALAWRGNTPRFVVGLRSFIFSKFFTPFFLGVLLGHWYHPVPRWYDIMDKKVYRHKQFFPPIILIIIGFIIMGIGWGVFNYGSNNPTPNYINFIVVMAGVLLGAILWPVRVLQPILMRRD